MLSSLPALQNILSRASYSNNAAFIYSIQLSFLTAAIQFQILSPPNQADERRPGVINVPILVTLDPVTSVLQNDVAVFVSVVGGTATGRKICMVWCIT